MRVICLACGHKIELDETYCDYAGPVRCVTCGALLEIRIEKGALKSMALTCVET